MAANGRVITLIENPDGWWTARDLEVNLSAQGETRAEALKHLDSVVAAGGHAPTDDELRELGVDPVVARQSGGDLPDVLQ